MPGSQARMDDSSAHCCGHSAVIPCPLSQQPPAPFSCFSFPEAHFRSLEAQRQRCLPWAWKALRAQQRGKLSQQFRPHVLVEPLICWKYHLELSTALSDWVDTTGFWVNTKGFTVNTSCEVGTDQELPLAHSAVCWHWCLW